jgi:trk system potassium uptake protein TrkA
MAIKKFCVIGLGHFGMNLAMRLSEAGAEVLAIDNHEDKIEMIRDKVAYAARLDSTDERALQSFGLQEMDAVIVAIGEAFESSLMTTGILQEMGVKKIMNRVISPVHERLLKLMNVDELLVPEAEAAQKLANRLMVPGIIESFEIGGNYGVFEIAAPKPFVGKTLIELELRKNYSLNVITIKKISAVKGLMTKGKKEKVEIVGVPSPDTVVKEGDILVLFGTEKNIKNIIE